MEQSPSSEANSCSATQEILSILWNPKVRYHLHKSLPLVPILSQINPVHTPHPISLKSSLMLSSHLQLDLSNGLIPSRFSIKTLHAPLSSHIFYMPCPVHPIFLGLITPISGKGASYEAPNNAIFSSLLLCYPS
jgi:hypothetical protein